MTVAGFIPKDSGVTAFLNKIYEIKFSRHVPLTVVILSAVYAVYRSQHYLSTAFKLQAYVSVPTAIFLELLVLGASAATFIAFRALYVAQLKKEDEYLSGIGVAVAITALLVAFVALLGVAWADAWLVTQDVLASFLMTLAQFVQASFIVGFIVNSLLDERAQLREEYAQYQSVKHEVEIQRIQDDANRCPYCKKSVSINNRSRHMRSCPLKP